MLSRVLVCADAESVSPIAIRMAENCFISVLVGELKRTLQFFVYELGVALSNSEIRKKCSVVRFDDEVSRRQRPASGVNTEWRRSTSPAAARESKSRESSKVAATRRCQTCVP